MATFANALPNQLVDGVIYSSAVPLTATEADLFNQAAAVRLLTAVRYNAAVQAVVQLTSSGGPLTNSSYVVLQTDLGDGVWIDVAWCVWTGTTGTATFLLCSGVAGANSFQQSRAAGTAPSSNGSNQMSLGGRIRFVGKATLTGAGSSSSSSSGSAAAILATITFKQLALR